MKYSVDDVLKNIMQKRNREKITQKQIGDVLNVTEATYNRIESGKIGLKYEDLTKIASLFGMSVIDLLTYPDTYKISNSTKTKRIFVEIEMTESEFEESGIKNHVIKALNK